MTKGRVRPQPVCPGRACGFCDGALPPTRCRAMRQELYNAWAQRYLSEVFDIAFRHTDPGTLPVRGRRLVRG